MHTTRQDAWTKDEDLILAETVLRYIREGKTQLEAFQEVAEQLSRTSAACGFRWNATLRKQYQSAIQLAREERKTGNKSEHWVRNHEETNSHQDSLEKAILLLKKLKIYSEEDEKTVQNNQEHVIQQLKQENEHLKKQLTRYHEAWREMGNLWEWVENMEVKQ